jgi:ABC-type branched-subunit amino acid transport system substrate-binding protein
MKTRPRTLSRASVATRISAAALIAGALGLVLATEGAGRPLTIGLLLSTNACEAASMRYGAAMGVEHAQSRLGAAIRLVFRAQPGQWGSEGNAVAELALDEEAAGLVTPADGAAAHQVLQVAGRTRIPVISLCADSSVTAAGVPWAARIVARTEDEARALFDHVQPRPARWAMVIPPGRAGREIGQDLRNAAATAGQHLLEPVRVDSESLDGAVRAILAAQADAVLLWIAPELAARCARALRQAAFRGTLAGPSRLNSHAFLSCASESGIDCLSVALRSDSTFPKGAGRHSGEHVGPAPDWTAVMTADAVVVLAHVISSGTAPGGGSPFRGRLQGASGTIEFDSAGNRLGPVEALVCRNGRFERPPSRDTSPHKPEMETQP